jgi:hypothetical protein
VGQHCTHGIKETNLDQVVEVKLSETGPFILERYFTQLKPHREISICIVMVSAYEGLAYLEISSL